MTYGEAPATSSSPPSEIREQIDDIMPIIPMDAAELRQVLNQVVSKGQEVAQIERQEILSALQRQVQVLTESLQAMQQKQELVFKHVQSLAVRYVGINDILNNLTTINTDEMSRRTKVGEVSYIQELVLRPNSLGFTYPAI